MVRPKEDMTYETFKSCLAMAQKFVQQGTQRELNLAGIGESTLHPQFADWVHEARAAVGYACHIVLSTNGVGVTQEHVDALRDNQVSVYVSAHRPEKAALTINMLRQAGIFRNQSDGAWMASVDWAGQVDWPVTAGTKGTPCPWLHFGRVTAFSDGKLSTCCFDSDGSGVVGTIEDLIQGKELFVEPYRLCGPCHHEIAQREEPVCS